jgi:hypothetical protein
VKQRTDAIVGWRESSRRRRKVILDEERTATMVSNLMVVLCGDQPPSPIVNAGSLYT